LKWYIAAKTNPDGQRLKAALDKFREVGLCKRKNTLEKPPTKQRKVMHMGMYFIAPMLLLLFLIMF